MRTVFLVAVVFLFSVAAVAQHHGGIVVKGSEHPELIPDTVAYYNFFHARSASSAAFAEQKAFDDAIRAIGLDQKDELEFRFLMEEFRRKQEAWDARHTALAQKNMATGDKWWTGGTNAIVTQTRRDLEKNLSPAGVKNYEAAVQVMRQRTVWTHGGDN